MCGGWSLEEEVEKEEKGKQEAMKGSQKRRSVISCFLSWSWWCPSGCQAAHPFSASPEPFPLPLFAAKMMAKSRIDFIQENRLLTLFFFYKNKNSLYFLVFTFRFKFVNIDITWRVCVGAVFLCALYKRQLVELIKRPCVGQSHSS